MQRITTSLVLVFLVALWRSPPTTNGFSPPTTPSHQSSRAAYYCYLGPSLVGGGYRRLQAFVLEASAGKKKATRRRVRKQAPGATAEDPVKQAQAEAVDSLPKVTSSELKDDGDDESPAAEQLTEKDRMLMEDVATFEFSPPKANVVAATTPSSSSSSGVSGDKKIAGPSPDLIQALKRLEEVAAAKEESAVIEFADNEMLAPPSSSSSGSGTSDSGDVIPLPDIRQALKKKAVEEELKRMEAEKQANRVKIKRSDKEAFRKLLEQQPFADADDSFFVEEEYGAVSALLGEGAATFLGIPSGPIQVSHFIGALVIVLMAFVDYPGFPLTNLPTPLREGLQGGLATTYAINTVLAVLAAFKAPERGQPLLLWVPKTFLVGGLAYDQLLQLPTLEEISAKNSRKGARAPKR